jgi:hypothetical protein
LTQIRLLVEGTEVCLAEVRPSTVTLFDVISDDGNAREGFGYQ